VFFDLSLFRGTLDLFQYLVASLVKNRPNMQ
jgi:hypothetical protein